MCRSAPNCEDQISRLQPPKLGIPWPAWHALTNVIATCTNSKLACYTVRCGTPLQHATSGGSAGTHRCEGAARQTNQPDGHHYRRELHARHAWRRECLLHLWSKGVTASYHDRHGTDRQQVAFRYLYGTSKTSCMSTRLHVARCQCGYGVCTTNKPVSAYA